MKITAEPRSDQWNADDFIGGPRTFTIGGVKVGTAEQKYDIELVEGDGRFWRPPLTMLRLLISAWGDEANAWTGRRVTLYRDETVRFGSDAVGGIRVSHMSHLPGNKTLSVKLTSTRGRRASVTVEPLPDGPTPTPTATSDGLSAEARRKWADRMLALLAEGDCEVEADQLIVITALAGRKPDEQPTDLDAITDDELRTVVNALNAASKDGSLGSVITELINTAALDLAAATAKEGTE